MPTIGDRAVDRLLLLEDAHEVGGPNSGPIVEWACKRWLSEHRYREDLAAGLLQWCAGAACSAFDDVGSEQIRALASLRCSVMLERARLLGLEVPIFDGQGLLDLQRGDLLWTDRDGDGKPNHIVLVVGVEFAEGTTVHTISGNAGPKADRVARRSYHAGPVLLAAARLVR